MTITSDQIASAYEISEAYYDKKLKRAEAVSKLLNVGMNAGSAAIYIQVYQHLIDGEGFTRTLSAESFDYFLGEIKKRLGYEKLNLALTALKHHIEYYEGLGKGKLNLTTSVYKKYVSVLVNEYRREVGLDEEEQSFPEGKELYRLHRFKERNQALIKAAKAKYQKENTMFSCQVCSFSFEMVYGKIGEGFIEAHHLFPVSQLKEQTTSKVEDIVFLCSNCHRMIHRRRPWISTVDELKAMISNDTCN